MLHMHGTAELLHHQQSREQIMIKELFSVGDILPISYHSKPKTKTKNKTINSCVITFNTQLKTALSSLFCGVGLYM